MAENQKIFDRWRHLLGEEFLSIFLSLGLLLAVLSMLAHQTAWEYDNAKDKAVDTTGFAISTYADNLSAIMMKADSIALLAARRLTDQASLPDHLEQQLTAIVQDDRDIAGYMHITAEGAVADSFIFQNVTADMLNLPALLARHRDGWIEPAFMPSEGLGLKPSDIAIERGIWHEDGRFAGVVVVLVSVGSPYEDSPLEKFLTGAKVRIASLESNNIHTDEYLQSLQKAPWLDEQDETDFWDRYHAAESLRASTVRLQGDLVLARENLPGLPVTVFMQIASDRFFENYFSTLQNALIASVIIVAVAVFLFLQIHLDRKMKRTAERRRRSLDTRLQFALDTAGQGLWDWNVPEARGYFSHNFYRLLEISADAKNITYDALRERIHPDDRHAFTFALKSHIEGKTSSFEVEARMKIGQDRDRWEWFLHTGSANQRDANGHPTHIIGLLKNIHHQKLRSMNLEFEAFHDPLTGLLNRTAFDDRAARLHARAQRTKASYSIIMLDVDHFKRVNDTYGHDSGDIVLQHISSTALSALRLEEEKLFFRLGGEEFVILLPDTDSKSAMFLAERIRTLVEKSAAWVDNEQISATISLGIASNHEAEKPRDVLKRADTALYHAKQNGRNQTCVASPDDHNDMQPPSPHKVDDIAYLKLVR